MIRTATLLAGLLAVPLFAASVSPQGPITVGDTAAYTFRSEPVHAMGVKSLEAMRGKPVLVEFWGTH
ncbi:MAG: hypothetical protein H6830_08575 [Planctomycetes bacterium]|nr:hypothetical protein [Planctomycetota bacterium]MCB9909671.1 hypothetical protein [Planctomycetota bacterium]MCB9911840.1 hypothetical protein [Planctomycetota bacterium]HPF14791.1 hypothetical protein [Planctomycetota bacterium]